MRRYSVKYVIGGLVVNHEIDFMTLHNALDSSYWHTQYFGAEAILVYHGSDLIAEIQKEDE